MLSIIPLKDAQAAKSYYEKDNYYVKGSKEAIEASHWYGKGANLLGLSGYVEISDFERLLDGKLPDGTQLGRIEKGAVKHRPGYDLTFSAPKSVSILAKIGGDKRLQEAHDKAVKAALKYVQQDGINTRVFRNGEVVFERVDNLTAALFRHDTSRALDPQMHTHCVLINAVFCTDNKWRSVSSESLFDMKMALGVTYRAELAKLAKNLGYEVNITHADGRFELVGVPDNVIRKFSKRRQKIEKILAEKGWEGAKASENITVDSRDKKQEAERNELNQKWQDEAKDLSFDPKKIVGKSLDKSGAFLVKTDQRKTNKIARHSLNHALAHLSEMESVFPEHDIIKESLSYGIGSIVLSDVKNVIKSAHKKSELILIDENRWTTPAAKALEESNVELMKKAQDTVKPITSADVISSFTYASDKAYTRGQIDAMKLILTTKDRVVGIQGDAGSGKTTMLKAVKSIADQAGYSILGISPTKDAALEMEAKAGIDSITVHKFLQESQYKKPKSYNPTAPLLLIVDESSMLGSRQMNELLKTASLQNIRVSFVGDVKQLSAVTAGKPFYLLQKFGMKTAIMREIVRQKADSLVKKSIELIQQGEIEQGLSYVTVREIDHKEKRLQKIADEYLSYSPNARKNTLVLVPANVDRLAVNQLIREGLKKEGTLTGTEVPAKILLGKNLSNQNRSRAIHYDIADVIVFNRDYPSLEVSRGEKLSVVHIHKRKNSLILQRSSGRKLILDLNRVKRLKPDAFTVYKEEQRSLMVGDNIRFLKNEDIDKTQSMVNGHMAEVTSVNEKSVTLLLKSGKTMQLPLDRSGYQHWDYAFAHTVHAAQGKDKTRVIAHIESYQPKLTHLSSLYTIITRAQFEVCLIADDKAQCINTIEKNTGQKISVLEELGMTPDWKKEIENTQSKENIKDNPIGQKKVDSYTMDALRYPSRKHWNLDTLQTGLTQNAESLCQRLLGDANTQLSNHSQLRYGKKGSLSIIKSGQYAGTWKNFETDESGNMIQLIQAQGFSFKEALDYAGSFLGLFPEPIDIFSPWEVEKQVVAINNTITPDQKDFKAIARAEKIALESVPIEGTIADTYLTKHRCITASPGENYRFHPALFEPETKQKHPALISIAKSQKGEVQAVQAIYLDPNTANKADVLVKKRTYGRMRFGAGVYSGVENSKEVYLAEGPETALSILSAKPKSSVIAALSISNFKRIEFSKLVRSVTICMDNDGENHRTDKYIDTVVNNLLSKGLTVKVIKPDSEKSDFNDLLTTKGKEVLLAKLDQAVEIQKHLSTPLLDLQSTNTQNSIHKKKDSISFLEVGL